MSRRQLLAAGLVAAAAVGAPPRTDAATPLRVNGSTTVNPIVASAAKVLRHERGLEIRVDTLGGSSGGIAALADGRADVAMSSRPIGSEDRRRYPQIDFTATVIGYDAVALAVSRDVWVAGVRSLSARQMSAIYESRIRNWRQVGGPDRRIAFFNKEPGRGTWEVFANWLYGDPESAPLVSFPEIGSNEEGRQKVASTPGALTQLSAAWADGERVFALALAGADGRVTVPSPETVGDGSYAMSRPLLLVTDGPPRGSGRDLIGFLLDPGGQRLVEEAGYLGVGARIGVSMTTGTTATATE